MKSVFPFSVTEEKKSLKRTFQQMQEEEDDDYPGSYSPQDANTGPLLVRWPEGSPSGRKSHKRPPGGALNMRGRTDEPIAFLPFPLCPLGGWTPMPIIRSQDWALRLMGSKRSWLETPGRQWAEEKVFHLLKAPGPSLEGYCMASLHTPDKQTDRQAK